MSLPASIGHPVFAPHLLVWFGVVLAFGLAFTALTSPRRRKAVGDVRFMAGHALRFGAPLFGVIVVRGAVTLGHVQAGENVLLANLNGIVWGFVFAILARLFLILFPPTAWLLKEHRRAHREASFLRAVFAGAPRSMSVGR